MKIVHSFWSKPAFFQGKVSQDNRSAGGWLEPKYHYYSWALSCLKSLEYYPTELVTDSAGKEVLIDRLKLPYTKVVIALDALKKYPADLWALGKIVAYSLQRVPFIHIDSDVYLWSRFDQRITDAALTAQNVEYNKDYYRVTVEEMKQLDFRFPDFAGGPEYPILAANAGIMGGRNIKFFKLLAREAFDFLETNRDKIGQLVHTGLLNLFIEQFFFQKLAAKENLKVEYYFQSGLPSTKMLVPFHHVPAGNAKYIHVYGKTFKRNYDLANKVEMNLKYHYPETYSRLNRLLSEWLIL